MKRNGLLLFLAILAAAIVSTAEARSLLYYYDFDTSADGSLVWQRQNRGTGSAELTLKSISGTTLGFAASGALGSKGSFVHTNQNSLWLGDGTTSLGCGTTPGFTISVWAKLPSSYGAWSDFLAFRIGNYDYRCEYTYAGKKTFTMYTQGGGVPLSDSVTYVGDQWHHLAWVCRNGTNELGACTFYLDGVAFRTMKIAGVGNLTAIQLGPCVRSGSSDRKTAASKTQLDEFAVFDYPATDEQVKWLYTFRPHPAVPSPSRAMPYAYQFFSYASGKGLLATNSGTGASVAYKADSGALYANWTTPGALGSRYGLNLLNNATYRVDGTEVDGLGATSASGFTFSFWLRAPGTPPLWKDFMAFNLGGYYVRLETNAKNPTTFTTYGADASNKVTVPASAVWYHYALAWNHQQKRLDVYRDGELQSTSFIKMGGAVPSDATALKAWVIGQAVWDNKGNFVRASGSSNYLLDELALFNTSLSTNQIAWLAAGAVPNLPPLVETNLTRTVTSTGVWSGNSAPWTDAHDSRFVRYPTLEDLDTTAEVTFADASILTNDTCVTAQRVAFLASGNTAAATLAATDTSTFAPEQLSVGAGLTLTVPFGEIATRGTLTLGADAKIVIDMAGYQGDPTALTCGALALPDGAEDPAAFFAVTDSRFRLVVNEARTAVSVALDTLAATAEWTRGAGTDNPNDAGNWLCRNTDGETLASALPCELTQILIPAAANCSFTTIFPYLVITGDTGASLATNCDWRALGTVRFKDGAQLDLGGHSLTLAGSTGAATVTDTVGGGAVVAEVADGATWTNADLLFTGLASLEKRGAGIFVAARAGQTYVGGTRVTAGTVRYGTARNPLGVVGVTNRVAAGAVVDMAGLYDPSRCVYSWELAGTLRQYTTVDYWNEDTCFIARDLVLTGDATIAGGAFVFGSPAAEGAFLTSNGHTLTFAKDEHARIGLGAWQDTDADGTLAFSGSWFEALDGGGLTRTRSVFDSTAELKLKGSYAVGDLVYNGPGWRSNAGEPKLLVHGVYTAGTMRPPLEMQDGSTIDLSKAAEPLSLDGIQTNLTASTAFTLPGAVTFANDATVQLNIGLPRTYYRTKLLGWATAPTNLASVAFQIIGARQQRAEVRADGVYLPPGLTITFR